MGCVCTYTHVFIDRYKALNKFTSCTISLFSTRKQSFTLPFTGTQILLFFFYFIFLGVFKAFSLKMSKLNFWVTFQDLASKCRTEGFSHIHVKHMYVSKYNITCNVTCVMFYVTCNVTFNVILFTRIYIYLLWLNPQFREIMAKSFKIYL